MMKAVVTAVTMTVETGEVRVVERVGFYAVGMAAELAVEMAAEKAAAIAVAREVRTAVELEAKTVETNVVMGQVGTEEEMAAARTAAMAVAREGATAEVAMAEIRMEVVVM